MRYRVAGGDGLLLDEGAEANGDDVRVRLLELAPLLLRLQEHRSGTLQTSSIVELFEWCKNVRRSLRAS